MQRGAMVSEKQGWNTNALAWVECPSHMRMTACRASSPGRCVEISGMSAAGDPTSDGMTKHHLSRHVESSRALRDRVASLG